MASALLAKVLFSAYVSAMVKPAPIALDSNKLKKLLHEKIDEADEGRLSLLNRIVMQLEAEDLAASLDKAFDEDRESGKPNEDRVQKVLAQVRAQRPYK
jgi:hypothetical protein